MAAVIAGRAKGVYDDAGNSSTNVVTSAITTQATGSVFVLYVMRQDQNAITVSDSKSNTYTEVVNVDNVFDGINVYTDIYIKIDGVGGSGHTWTINSASTNSYISAFAEEITGADLAALLSAITSAGQNDAASPFVDPGITVGAETLLLAFATAEAAVNTAFVPGNSFTLGDEYPNGAVHWEAAVANRYVTGSGTYNCTWTKTTAAEMNCLILAIPSAVTGGAINTRTLTSSLRVLDRDIR